MDTITIEGLDEHDFRFAIEDMLRADRADDAIERLRALLEPYAGDGGILPRRFLEVSAKEVRIAGWHKLAERLHDHDRPFRPISAIGVALSDYRNTGAAGPQHGRLAPFVKTFYFSDEAYPFSDATRDDLLDGYTREGFGWQGDYQATDATLAFRGIDDLYGAIVELENRLLESGDPAESDIHAGTIGACFISALIHQALRNKIREEGLPRPLCVLAACDGVFPFFDAPVAGVDDCLVVQPEDQAEAAEEAAPAVDLYADISLQGAVARKGTKSPVLALNEEEVWEAARQTERAGAQRMCGDDKQAFEEMLHAGALGPQSEFEYISPATDEPRQLEGRESAAEEDYWAEPFPELDAAPSSLVPARPIAESSDAAPPDGFAEVPEAPGPSMLEQAPTPPMSHSLRARVRMADPVQAPEKRNVMRLALNWLVRAILRR